MLHKRLKQKQKPLNYFNVVQAGLNFTILLPQPSKYWRWLITGMCHQAQHWHLSWLERVLLLQRETWFRVKSRCLCRHCSISITGEPFRFVPRSTPVSTSLRGQGKLGLQTLQTNKATWRKLEAPISRQSPSVRVPRGSFIAKFRTSHLSKRESTLNGGKGDPN